MAICSEFTYADENEFIQSLLIPLLQRLGFGTVVNYHGTREFGRDLIFAEIDRFGHVIYFGLQAKYKPSISLSDVKGLIDDCEQAFAHPFSHPQTHTTEYISRFYIANGGSIADQAREDLFVRMPRDLRSNVRLLDGRSLIALDRVVTLTTIGAIRSRLAGLRRELQSNSELVPLLVARYKNYAVNRQPFMERFRTSAGHAFLTSPWSDDERLTEAIGAYIQVVDGLNHAFGAQLVPLQESLIPVALAVEEAESLASNIRAQLEVISGKLAPLIPL